jgi:hypothetical protein
MQKEHFCVSEPDFSTCAVFVARKWRGRPDELLNRNIRRSTHGSW